MIAVTRQLGQLQLGWRDIVCSMTHNQQSYQLFQLLSSEILRVNLEIKNIFKYGLYVFVTSRFLFLLYMYMEIYLHIDGVHHLADLDSDCFVLQNEI
jgi:hypothetical protein